MNEWNETADGSLRGVGGGSWQASEVNLRASNIGANTPVFETDLIGFRVATLAVPEPASLILILTGLMSANLSCIQRGRRNG